MNNKDGAIGGVGNRQNIKVGDKVWTWCSKGMDRFDHVYTGYSLECQCPRHQELRQQQEASKSK